MDKKRVFNAAVTARLSLSMVLASVPAVALADTTSGISVQSQQIDVAIKLSDGTIWLGCDDEGHLVGADAVDLTGIESFTWTDSQGVGTSSRRICSRATSSVSPAP